MLDLLLLSVTAIALLLAAVSGVITWRVLRLDRRRSEQRIADLKTVAAATDSGAAEAETASPAGDPALMFARAGSTAPGSTWLAATAGFVVFVIAVALGVQTVANRHAPVTGGRAPSPLELLSLDPVRDGDRIVLRGQIRNPASGAPHLGVVAVVQVFDRSGASGNVLRVPIRDAALAPGHESAFEVLLGSSASVARYRLTFVSDRGPVTHVDGRPRTGVTSAARNAAALDVRRGSAPSGR